MASTFKVDDVEPDRPNEWQRSSASALQTMWKRMKRQDVEVHSAADKQILTNVGNNPLVSAVGLAYNEHLPLSLTPDAVWLCIAQGLGIWINENAEEVRKHFVDFEGKTKITIEVPPRATHACPLQVLDAFSEALKKFIGKKRDLFVADFSTTGPDEKAAFEVSLMYAMKSYFTYGMRTMCGFPQITLEGTLDDWRSVRDRVRVMAELELTTEGGVVVPIGGGLRWWTVPLLAVLNQFVLAAEGRPDLDFWRSFYREGGGSGGPFITGRVNVFMPYLTCRRSATGYRQNPFVVADGEGVGPNPSDYPPGLAEVDVEWDDNGLKRDMKFYGGLVGVSMGDDYTVRPECGWAIGEAIGERKEQEQRKRGR